MRGIALYHFLIVKILNCEPDSFREEGLISFTAVGAGNNSQFFDKIEIDEHLHKSLYINKLVAFAEDKERRHIYHVYEDLWLQIEEIKACPILNCS